MRLVLGLHQHAAQDAVRAGVERAQVDRVGIGHSGLQHALDGRVDVVGNGVEAEDVELGRLPELEDFRTLDQLGPDAFADLPADVSVYPAFADITDQIERKITGISIYESQVERLFDGSRQMGDAVRSYGAALASVGDVDGQAERYWRTSRV